MAASEHARWDAFVEGCDDGTFYHLSGWQSIIEKCLGHPAYYTFVEREGAIEGVLPLARVRSWLFGDALVSVPFLVYGGPLARNSESLQLLIQFACDLAEELGVDYLEFRNLSPLTDWPAKSDHVTFRKEIDPDVDANLKAIPRKQRAVIRKALKNGLVAELDEQPDRLHAILSECKRNLGTPFFSEKYLATIKDTFRDNCEIQTILYEGQVLASVMSFRFRNQILPYYGGGGLAARPYGANDFMYWKVMERACEQGLEVFDFGRSRKGTGPYNFKKYWGFVPEELSYEFHLVRAGKVPSIDPSSKKYESLVAAWSKLPLPVARLAGPPLARLLG